MSEYRAVPAKAWMNDWHELMPHRPTEYVVEADPTPQRTGLLNAQGVPLYRVPERVPLGFDLTTSRSPKP